MYGTHPYLAQLDEISPADTGGFANLAQLGGAFDKAAFVSPIEDFYLTNPIARASKVMAESSAMKKARTLKAAE
jgi:NADH-quinone oxidoreductase subunit G